MDDPVSQLVEVGVVFVVGNNSAVGVFPAEQIRIDCVILGLIIKIKRQRLKFSSYIHTHFTNILSGDYFRRHGPICHIHLSILNNPHICLHKSRITVIIISKYSIRVKISDPENRLVIFLNSPFNVVKYRWKCVLVFFDDLYRCIRQLKFIFLQSSPIIRPGCPDIPNKIGNNLLFILTPGKEIKTYIEFLGYFMSGILIFVY